MKKIILPLLSGIVLFACQTKPDKVESEKKELVIETEVQPEKVNPFEKNESKHQKQAFLEHEAIQFDIQLEFGGQERLKGKITTLTNSSASLIEMDGGEKIYVNKDKVYVSAGLAENKAVRFDAYTWNYFFLFPYKLNDPGTQSSEYSQETVAEVVYDTKKLTFDAGTGDAPDDWYIIYSDSDTDLIKYAAYIVTAGRTSREKAEEDPHAIEYADFKEVNGIPISHTWVFWEWRQDEGFTKTLGKAELSNITFVDAIEEKLTVPEGYVER